MSDQPEQPQRPAFNPNAAHTAKPKLRRVRGFPLPAQTPDGKQVMFLGLADAQQISPKIVGTNPAFQLVLPLMDGSRDLPTIVGEVGRGLQLPMLQDLVAQLDDAGLLEGPVFQAMLAKVRADFDKAETLPPGATAAFTDMLVVQELGEDVSDEQKAELGPTRLRQQFDAWIAEALKDASDPSFDALPAAIVVPHLDYARGWPNYARVYGRLRVVDRPDRVVILGTNHFGFGTGVTTCDKGYESPLGTSPLDKTLLDALKSKLGNDLGSKLLANRFDHENEHSIELQIPWLQHAFGEGADGNHIPVLGILVHDPAVNNGESYDGQGVPLDSFVDALRASLDQVGGKTLVVSSADLSHIGPAFGDQQSPLGEDEQAKAFRDRVVQHDREMLDLLMQGKHADLVGSMAWQQNPTRWCSTGNIVAAMRTAGANGGRVRVLHYHLAGDGQGAALVTSIAGVIA